jgi:hypothetical protein
MQSSVDCATQIRHPLPKNDHEKQAIVPAGSKISSDQKKIEAHTRAVTTTYLEEFANMSTAPETDHSLEIKQLRVAMRTANIAAISATLAAIGVVVTTGAALYVAKRNIDMQAFNLAAASPDPGSAYCNVSHWASAGLVRRELADPGLDGWKKIHEGTKLPCKIEKPK